MIDEVETEKTEDGILVRAFDPGKAKVVVVGKIIGDTFYKEVNRYHFMVKEHGYGIQTLVLDRLLRNKVEKIVITTNKGTMLISDLNDWVLKGNTKKYGHGKQTFLDVKFMRSKKGGNL